jgi:hypothetical protein
MKEEWLLTDEEIAKEIDIMFPDLVLKDRRSKDMLWAIAKAQLTKAEPLIRKDERDRILAKIEKHQNTPRLYHHMCYGKGGMVLLVDYFSDKRIIQCRWAGEKDSCAPNKPCDGKLEGYKELTPNEYTENRLIDKILQALKGESK